MVIGGGEKGLGDIDVKKPLTISPLKESKNKLAGSG